MSYCIHMTTSIGKKTHTSPYLANLMSDIEFADLRSGRDTLGWDLIKNSPHLVSSGFKLHIN